MRYEELSGNVDKAIVEIFRVYVGPKKFISYEGLYLKTGIGVTSLYDYSDPLKQNPNIARALSICSVLPSSAMDMLLEPIGMTARVVEGDVDDFEPLIKSARVVEGFAESHKDGVFCYRDRFKNIPTG